MYIFYFKQCRDSIHIHNNSSRINLFFAPRIHVIGERVRARANLHSQLGSCTVTSDSFQFEEQHPYIHTTAEALLAVVVVVYASIYCTLHKQCISFYCRCKRSRKKSLKKVPIEQTNKTQQ